jgi:hypothetical protein
MEINRMDNDDIDAEDLEELEELDTEADPDDDVDPEDLDSDDDFEDDDFEDDEAESDDDSVGATVVRKAGADDDEDEDDLLTADDVEEDLDKILKDKLTAEETAGEDEEEPEVDDRGAAEEGLQPKRADEQLCSRCFLLVRRSAPVCPVGDDECPIFAS